MVREFRKAEEGQLRQWKELDVMWLTSEDERPARGTAD